MTDDERLAEFLGNAQCSDPVGWQMCGELVAAIEAKGWTLKLTGPWWPPVVMPGPGKYEATIWLEQNMEGNAGFASTDNLPEALKLAVLAALEASLAVDDARLPTMSDVSPIQARGRCAGSVARSDGMKRLLLCLLLNRHEESGRFLESPVDNALFNICRRCGRVLP